MAKFQEYPLLALRGRVVFPDTTVNFDIGRMISLTAVKYASERDSRIFVCAQKEAEKEEITTTDVYLTGTVVKLRQLTRLPGSNLRLSVEGLFRATAKQVRTEEGTFVAVVEEISPVHGDKTLEEAYFRTCKEIMRDITSSENRFPKDASSNLDKCADADGFVNLAAHYLPLKVADKQKLLECARTSERLQTLDRFLNEELEIMRLERKINAAVRQNIDKNQKEYYLREQLKAIHGELGDDGEECDELENKIKERGFPEEVEKKALKELSRMSRMQTSSPDYNVLRVYLDWLLDIPWKKRSKVNKDLQKALDILEKDHYGLDKVKERIVEYLAVQSRADKVKGPILCLVGPPGVGKTSLGKSIARATGRSFVRASLGGMRDEAEIRGHRRTYIGSMPGKIIKGMKKAATSNPLFLLDEIDKLGNDWRGDPSSALLEVLDPEQNAAFNDHYLEVDYDLSDVMFVTTANSLDMPRPLLDRMEIIRLSGYTEDEKIEISKRHLIPKIFEENAVKPHELVITDEAIRDIVRYYTREAGVRNLERELSKIARKAVKDILLEKNGYVEVNAKNLEKYLGVIKYRYGEAESEDHVGVTTGLAWTEVGGDILFIEAVDMPGKGKITQTGKLGDVMKESIETAYSVVRAHSKQLGIDPEVFEKTDIHVHVPEGATPKDGPSAGIAMYTTLVSVLTKIPVRKDVAMTGEITLQGRVLPIGGLKEKLLSALRGGIKTVIIPKDNEKDLAEIPDNVKKGMKIIPVDEVSKVLEIALKDKVKPQKSK